MLRLKPQVVHDAAIDPQIIDNATHKLLALISEHVTLLDKQEQQRKALAETTKQLKDHWDHVANAAAVAQALNEDHP